MKNIKVTLITTVKNEERTIASFLESVKNQTRKPHEIIIVDANSTDKTVEYIKKSGLKITLLVKKGNRSVGRNTAIKKSSNQVIAVTDVGCVLDKNWLEKITNPFHDESVDVVSGFYKPKAQGIFEKCLAAYTCTMEDKLDKKSFLPSSRSIAFKKKSWERVGGYPEYLDTCEDLVFASKMKQQGLEFVTQEKAFVWWRQRKNIFLAFKQFFSYAQGDGEAHFFRKSTPFLFGRYVVGLIILFFAIMTSNIFLFSLITICICAYLLWAIRKNYKYVKNIRAIIYLPLLQIVSDVAVILGTSLGFIKSKWKSY